MDSLEILKGAYELIKDKENWCINSLAEDGPRYCVLGAVHVAAWGTPYSWEATGNKSEEQKAYYLLETHSYLQFNADPVSVNNVMGHEAIIKCLKDTIALEEEKRYGKNIEPVKEREEKVVTGV